MRTSRGVPARLRMRTTLCTPEHSSKVRRAAGASTRMQRSVSSTTEERYGALGFDDDLPSLEAEGVEGVLFEPLEALREGSSGYRCRETTNRSTKICWGNMRREASHGK